MKFALFVLVRSLTLSGVVELEKKFLKTGKPSISEGLKNKISIKAGVSIGLSLGASTYSPTTVSVVCR